MEAENMSKETLKQKLNNFFETDSPHQTFYNLAISALIILSIILLLGEYKIVDIPLTHIQFVILDIVIASIFLADYLTRFYAAFHKRKFVTNIFNIIDLVAIIPSFIVVFSGGETTVAALRALRFLRFLRVLRIFRFIYAVESELREKKKRKDLEQHEIFIYDSLVEFYNKVKSGKAAIKDIKSIDNATKNSIAKTQGNITKLASEVIIDENQMFYMSFCELAQQIEVTLRRFNLKNPEFQLLKLKNIIREMEDLLSSANSGTKLKEIEPRKYTLKVQITRLLKLSLQQVMITFAFAIAANFALKYTKIYDSLGPVVSNLSLLEAGMGALIVFITSFNLSYAITKRGQTDIALIDFSNKMNIYSVRIKSMIDGMEKNAAKKDSIYKEIDYHFNCIGFNILNGVRETNRYNLKFDPVTFQSFEKVKRIIDPYLLKLDDVTRNRVETIRDELVEDLNTFQIISTIRVPNIFNSLNSWMIRITYFILTAIAPYSILPRLFIINVMQRAFFITAKETDSAIFTASLSQLPVEDRVIRRLNRISKVLS